ncbi:DUF1636 domain-containing protein [Sphingomonas xinjiangensis]|uniref:Putative metal-binding protein n=1 Tax=Sphingomonas xinjiangensis TaxID=643568 RepID=A0A840YDM1_9SPHN|nr:DUF1636 domain-containing protein [Sphingomonas xinjiangensis]MBB5710944.1 putative metal-binding protein [Sphingomonas xinjiangensis]
MKLVPVGDGPAIVACNSCRFSAADKDDGEGRRGGALMVAALRAIQASDPGYAELKVEEMPCLFACTEFCTVHLRGAGKVGYVMGRFAPEEDAARAILDYAVHYSASEVGQVPYKAWPDGVKGHFIVRTPPAGFVVA